MFNTYLFLFHLVLFIYFLNGVSIGSARPTVGLKIRTINSENKYKPIFKKKKKKTS